MKLEQARELGRAAGLDSDKECILNVVFHAEDLFAYPDAGKEILELMEDAQAQGIAKRFKFVNIARRSRRPRTFP